MYNPLAMTKKLKKIKEEEEEEDDDDNMYQQNQIDMTPRLHLQIKKKRQDYKENILKKRGIQIKNSKCLNNDKLEKNTN